MDAPVRVEETLGVYKLIAAHRGGQARAAVFAGQSLLFSVAAPSLDDACSEARDQLARRRRQQREARQGGLPALSEMVDLIDSLSDGWRREVLGILGAHSRLNSGRATATEVARLAGTDSSRLWAAYKRLGRKLEIAFDARGNDHPDLSAQIAPVLNLAAIEHPEPEAEPLLVLRPETVEMVRICAARPYSHKPQATGNFA